MSFAVSDGDNYQLPLHVLLRMWADPAHGQSPISWTIPGAIPNLAPGVAEYYYANRTDQDRFITVDGVGYVYGSGFPDQQWLIEKSSQYLRRMGMDAIWLLDPAVENRSQIDGYLDSLATAAGLTGYVANYGRGSKTHDYTAGGIPILYTMINYDSDPVSTMTAVINEAIAGKAAGAPAYVFFGVSAWNVTATHMLQALGNFAGNQNVRPISVSQMLKLMTVYQPGW